MKRLGPTLLQAVGTVWLSIQLAKDASSAAWILPALVFIGGTVLAVWGSIATRHAQAERDKLREELDLLTAPRNERVHFLLRGLMNDLSIDTVNHRASLFIASRDSSFIQIGRYSLNAELGTTARLTHDAGQGIVAATWREVASVQNDLPKRRDQWEKKICREYGLPAEVVANLRMQSRSYVCLRIDRVEGASVRPVRVLILESTEPTGVVGSFLDHLSEANQMELLATECSAAQRLEKLRSDRDKR